ncbi:caspase recruitment domain-containing protein 9 isoform X2 [Microcaecilia unicolor]|uniref:Caspase recruitment domain-containing protein 9 isoform X2 n=1 Tax=Microcaecilia unicolor TaxID=1415580 RepID=A0A6P7YEW1_9AMPH|nr:caspase recruitment domain-containing protein 9 isoform X2 [Microcaecilia unicolor]
MQREEPSDQSFSSPTMWDVEDDDEECWNKLENYRVKLVSVIDPTRITPYLRQCRIISRDDEEQVFNDPNLVIRKRKVGVLMDILYRTGKKGYVAFLESLELYYPLLYKKITGNEPTRVFSMIIDTAGESGLTQLLMNEIMKLQQIIEEEKNRSRELKMWLSAKEDTIKQLQMKDGELRMHQERVHKMKEEQDNFNEELKKLKDENYDLAMRFAKQSEEKNILLMRNRDLLLEIEQLKQNLMRAEDDCKVERKHTLKLKHAIELRPSQDAIYEMQRENDLLKAQVQELENALEFAKEGKAEKNKLYIQTLENDRRQALEEYQDLVNNVYVLRKELRQAEDLQDKYMEEKEVFELQCQTLKRDSKMYKERIEVTLQQMEEISVERDQAIKTREQFHLQYSKSLVEKDAYRKQLRELGERYDELQIQLFRTQGQLQATETKLKRLESPNQEDRSSNEEQVNKERGRLKKSFEEHYRKFGKRALRLKNGNQQEVDCDNTTESDTDET